MSWNYRVMEHQAEGGAYRAIHEVYYDEAGKPTSYTADVGVMWMVSDGDEEGLGTLDKMRRAFTMPVLRPEDFEKDRT